MPDDPSLGTHIHTYKAYCTPYGVPGNDDHDVLIPSNQAPARYHKWDPFHLEFRMDAIECYITRLLLAARTLHTYGGLYLVLHYAGVATAQREPRVKKFHDMNSPERWRLCLQKITNPKKYTPKKQGTTCILHCTEYSTSYRPGRYHIILSLTSSGRGNSNDLYVFVVQPLYPIPGWWWMTHGTSRLRLL